jgi:GAF domain-containing protein
MSEAGGMEPTEESARTIEAFAEYGVSGLPEMLAESGRRVRQIVPAIWGMSVTLNDGDLTFTLVASSPEVAALDGVQYVAGGPCVAAAQDEREVGIEETDSPMVEHDWQLFAAASAAAGVRSTLSFPLRFREEVIGGVNLYASAENAFSGREAELAAVFGTWAVEGVSNADMTFASRDRAEHGPTRIAEQSEIDIAVGVLMGGRGLGQQEARAELQEAARRASIDELAIARAILSALRERRPDTQ